MSGRARPRRVEAELGEVQAQGAAADRRDPGQAASNRAITRRLIFAAAGAIVAAAAVLATVLVLVNRPDWWRGFVAASMVGALTAAVSVPPLVWGLHRSLMHAVGAYFVTAALKMMISIGGGLLAVLVGGYPPLSTMVLIVVYYFAVLIAESVVMGLSMWSARA